MEEILLSQMGVKCLWVRRELELQEMALIEEKGEKFISIIIRINLLTF